MAVVTEVPDELRFRGIAPPEPAHGFRIMLDTAEPWGGGRIEGRVERLGEQHDRRPISVRVRCLASWLDVAPQLVGRKRLLSWSTYGDIRNRAVPIWLDEEVSADAAELEPLEQANWQHFAFELPDELPRALEGPSSRFAGRSRRAAHGWSAVTSRRFHCSSTSRRPCRSFASRRARSEPGVFSNGGRNSTSAAPEGPAR